MPSTMKAYSAILFFLSAASVTLAFSASNLTGGGLECGPPGDSPWDDCSGACREFTGHMDYNTQPYFTNAQCKVQATQLNGNTAGRYIASACVELVEKCKGTVNGSVSFKGATGASGGTVLITFITPNKREEVEAPTKREEVEAPAQLEERDTYAWSTNPSCSGPQTLPEDDCDEALRLLLPKKGDWDGGSANAGYTYGGCQVEIPEFFAVLGMNQLVQGGISGITNKECCNLDRMCATSSNVTITNSSGKQGTIVFHPPNGK